MAPFLTHDYGVAVSRFERHTRTCWDCRESLVRKRDLCPKGARAYRAILLARRSEILRGA